MVPVLEVYDASSGDDRLVGTARFSLRRGSISTTFAYDEAWLANGRGSYVIDPDLPLMAGSQHCSGIPGAFRDCSPDRWGRTLIKREAREEALQNDLPLHQLDDVDFLIGVFDQTREGALRFCEPGGSFLAASSPIPPIVQLPALLHASYDVARDDAGRDEIKALLAAGSGSLGGARPKASVCDGERLLLAKFSHPEDEWNVMAWEKTALDLARMAGIPTPACQLIRVGDESVLLLDRFDRESSRIAGLRIPYMSGMTILESADGETSDYAELAESIALLAKTASQELRELFKRVVFSVAINNTDDHMRNWGFLRHDRSWQLSPLFDVNPNPYMDARRVTSIAGEKEGRDATGVRDLAAYCGVSPDEASAVVENVLQTVGQWRVVAKKNGCPKRELEMFQPVFEHRAHDLQEAFTRKASCCARA